MASKNAAIEAIFKRRSIRKFKSNPVSDNDIEELLEAAMAAPSAGNEQPWQFIVIKDRATLDQIPNVHPYSVMVKQASLAILVCGDMDQVKHDEMWIQDCSAATENLLIAVSAKGLGAVWLGVYPRKERIKGLRKLLGIPKTVYPFALVPVGYPGEKKPPAKRFKKSRVHNDKW